MQLWHFTFSHEKPQRLMVYIDHPDGVPIEKCQQVARQLRFLLAATQDKKLISLLFDVSSPGTDRELIRPEHYQKYSGKKIKVGLRQERNGRYKLAGVLRGVLPEGIRMESDGVEELVSFTEIKIARVGV